MNILGIHEGHNASIALFRDHGIVYAVSEERLTRKKNEGGFPLSSIKRMFADTGISPAELDAVALCGRRAVQPKWAHKELILERYRHYCSFRPGLINRVKGEVAKRLPHSHADRIRRILRFKSVDSLDRLEQQRTVPLQGLSVPEDRILRIEHHECHASAAYYGLGHFDVPVLVISCDGGGDGLCATVSIGEDGRLRRIGTIPHEDSIAKLYALITYVMGFVPLEHEYKLMGMSPYASTERAERLCRWIEDRFLWVDGEIPKWKRRKGLPPTSYWYEDLEKRIRFERFDVIAAGFQRFIESMMERWVRACIERTGIPRLALSGGIFMNVKMNKILMELPELESIFIHPSCGDETNPFGACYAAAVRLGVRKEALRPVEHLYLGPNYDESDYREALEALAEHPGIAVDIPESQEARVVELLAEGRIVARYAGREEFGARALGNRSILADPSRLDVIAEINRMIKNRDFWMPFAGAMIEEDARENLSNPKGVPAPYMIITFDAETRIDEFKAATHPYDQTIRPQVVERDWNPAFHRILAEFRRITGKRGGLLNTSFNLHGHPIVSSPADAVDVFLRSGLKHLALGPYLLNKQDEG